MKAVLPKLQTGLDVNVKFTGVRDFEYTPECIIFDLLRVSLFHGWLVDPQEHEVVSAIGNNLFILPIYFSMYVKILWLFIDVQDRPDIIS